MHVGLHVCSSLSQTPRHNPPHRERKCLRWLDSGNLSRVASDHRFLRSRNRHSRRELVTTPSVDIRQIPRNLGRSIARMAYRTYLNGKEASTWSGREPRLWRRARGRRGWTRERSTAAPRAVAALCAGTAAGAVPLALPAASITLRLSPRSAFLPSARHMEPSA